jgi:hypothetical protein
MRTVVRRTYFVRFTHLLALTTVAAASICFAQDKRPAANAAAGKSEDDIKQLISMYAKAADEADIFGTILVVESIFNATTDSC